MRKLMFALALSLAAVASSVSTPAEAGGNHACPQCTTYADGSQCCVSCVCNAAGVTLACTDNICPPAGGID